MSDLRTLAIDLQQDVDAAVTGRDVIKKLEGRSKDELIELCNQLIDGRTLAQAIAAKDNAAILEFILEAGVELCDIDETLLNIAISQKAENSVRLMLKHGAALSPAEDDGKTPLHIAAEIGHVAILKSILDCGGKDILDELERSGCTALTMACMNGHEEVAEVLIDAGATLNLRIAYAPLHCSAFLGNLAIVRLLIQRGAEVNFQDASDETPLHYASYKGHKKVIEELLKHDSRTDIRDRNRKYPVDLAKSEEIKKLLTKDET